MANLKKYGKNQGKINFIRFITFLILAAVIGSAVFFGYKFIKPKAVAWQKDREQKKIAKEKEEQKRKEEKKSAAMEGGITFNAHTYKVLEEGKTWTEAKEYCESVGGHLAIVETEEEQVFLEGILKEKNLYWIGLSREKEEWLWVNGEPLMYAKWAGGGPDNFTGEETCAAMYNYPNPKNGNTNPGEWNDTQEDGECKGEEFFGKDNMGFLCEWDMEQ